MIRKIFIYALQTYRLCRFIWSCLVYIKCAFFPKANNICFANIIEDLRITCNRYCESVVCKNKQLKAVTTPILVPFRKSIYGKCPEKCRFCKDNGSEYNSFELKVVTPQNAKIDYFPGCMVVKIKNTARKYFLLVHLPSDDVMSSQGLDINHYASVLMFDDEQLVAVWAYHNEKGVIKLG